MRQVLSWRFVAAIAAVLGLALVVYVIQSQQGNVSSFAGSAGADSRPMDFISIVAAFEQSEFQMTEHGTVSGNLTLVMPTGQRVTAFPGTPGVVSCENLTDQYQCAVLGQSLGDTIVWFALVPLSGELRFTLPAIEDLEGGFARLVNGWEVPYAPVIDRIACDDDVASFPEFLEEHGQEFESIYDLSEGAIVAVTC